MRNYNVKDWVCPACDCVYVVEVGRNNENGPICPSCKAEHCPACEAKCSYCGEGICGACNVDVVGLKFCDSCAGMAEQIHNSMVEQTARQGVEVALAMKAIVDAGCNELAARRAFAKLGNALVGLPSKQRGPSH